MKDEGHLRVLLWPAWFPTDARPARGVYFRELARNLASHAALDTGVAYCDLRSLRTWRNGGWWRNRFQLTAGTEDGVSVARVHGWNVPAAQLRRRLYLKLGLQLLDYYSYRFGAPDLIHAHGLLPAGIVVRELAERAGRPYVVTEHSSAHARGLVPSVYESQLRRVLDGAAAVTAVSRFVGEQLRRYVGNRRIEIIPNMVDTDFFHPPAHSRSCCPFRFVSVSSLDENKALSILFRAFHRAFAGGPQTKLTVVGDGPERSKLVRLSEHLGIDGQVDFAGRLDREGVRRELWRSNALVSSSLVETFGVVLVEGMATGLPVVATRSGGPQEIVNRRFGVLATPGNVEELAAKMQQVRQRPLTQVAERELSAWTREKFSPARIAPRWRALYERSARPPGYSRSAGQE